MLSAIGWSWYSAESFEFKGGEREGQTGARPVVRPRIQSTLYLTKPFYFVIGAERCNSRNPGSDALKLFVAGLGMWTLLEGIMAATSGTVFLDRHSDDGSPFSSISYAVFCLKKQ